MSLGKVGLEAMSLRKILFEAIRPGKIGLDTTCPGQVGLEVLCPRQSRGIQNITWALIISISYFKKNTFYSPKIFVYSSL